LLPLSATRSLLRARGGQDTFVIPDHSIRMNLLSGVSWFPPRRQASGRKGRLARAENHKASAKQVAQPCRNLCLEPHCAAPGATFGVGKVHPHCLSPAKQRWG